MVQAARSRDWGPESKRMIEPTKIMIIKHQLKKRSRKNGRGGKEQQNNKGLNTSNSSHPRKPQKDKVVIRN